MTPFKSHHVLFYSSLEVAPHEEQIAAIGRVIWTKLGVEPWLQVVRARVTNNLEFGLGMSI